ncbi:hypothetical protein IFM89_012625 [Coptis chinensis]|uniref:Allene oxide synthase n=1 Tax=Coptis chinensis TaxID=261450 RepID=A0A835IPI0_9MAGN|nr:hypothetical protein IFM89_012625 [Coptis chinensis]
MASASLSVSPLRYSNKTYSKNRPIQSSLSGVPSIPVPTTTKSVSLPIRKIPGDYGLPIVGPYKDRLDYFYFQGRDVYFKSRAEKYNSTVFRANMPPGPPIASNPNVIVLLDAKSFPVLFDLSKVEKKDLFTGTYTPSLDLTGGYRVLSYLDPSEPNHAKLKNLIFFLLKSSRDRLIPEFHNIFLGLFEKLESEFSSNGKVAYNDLNDQACFNFLGKAFYGTNPADTKLGEDGPSIIQKWLLLQLSPILSLGLPWAVEDPLLHTSRLPSIIVRSDYQKLYNFFYESSGPILDEGEKLGVKRDESCHNILFSTCFNTFGGMKIFFPNLLKWVGRGGALLQRKLAEEIRSAIKSNGGKVSMSAIENMPLMKSCVYETLRIEPPVPLQYGKAKQDFVLESHDAAFEVKKGEMLFGFQPFATKDSRIFGNGEEFVPDRFVGEGEELLKYVVWSNGPETENPTVGNKQCPGKDFVVLVSRLLLVEFFLRYDSFAIEVGTSALGSAITLTSLKRATF